MANVSGDSPLISPDKPSKLDEQATSAPAFPNTRWMNVTTDLSRNPGILDDVFKKIKGTSFVIDGIEIYLEIIEYLDLMPPTFEGAKLSVTKMLSSHFQVSHSMTLSSGSNSGYKFGANYVGTQLYSQSEVERRYLPIVRLMTSTYLLFIDIPGDFR